MKGSVRNRGGKRLANGSYRGGTWTAYWWDERDGRPLQRSKGGFKTRAAAQEHLTAVLAAKKDATYVPPVDDTFGSYLVDSWLPSQRQRLRESTFDDYRRRIDNHIVPAIGGMPLQELSAVHLDRFYADLLASGKRGGKGLAPKSVRNVHIIVRKSLGDATRKRLVARNVALDADAPRVPGHADRDLDTWSPEELRSFLAGIRDHHLAPAFLLAVATGMRRGEVLGLQWEDVDLDGLTVAVRRTILNVAYRITPGEPKTARGRRTISIDAATAAVLRGHRASQLQRRLELGLGGPLPPPVFAKPDGRPIHPDLFSKTFDRTVKRLGLRKVRLHDLRHTYATLALRAGVDAKTVSARLGHSTVAFTLDVYTKAVPQLDREAADQIANLIFGGQELPRR